MLECGLLTHGETKSTICEIEDLRTKTEGSDLLRYLMELPEFPTEGDDADPVRARSTFFGRARQFVAARRRQGLIGKSDNPTDQKPTAMFLKTQLQAASKDKKLIAKVERMLKADQASAVTQQSQQPMPSIPEQSPAQQPSSSSQHDQALAFDDGKRFRAS